VETLYNLLNNNKHIDKLIIKGDANTDKSMRPIIIRYITNVEQDRQYTCNVTLRIFFATIVAVEKQ
jgi:hypothetical protein